MDAISMTVFFFLWQGGGFGQPVTMSSEKDIYQSQSKLLESFSNIVERWEILIREVVTDKTSTASLSSK